VVAERLSWQDSWRFLALRGGSLPENWPEDPGEMDTPSPEKKSALPCLRDSRYQEADFENLTLPRTLIDRCRFHGISFRNSDLHLSLLSGEFIDCDFSEAVLICAHLGQASFFACRFLHAILIGAELRGATLEHCDFTGADLTGARLDRTLKMTLPLSDLQRRIMVDWRAPDDEGPDEEEPEE
jgi:uncharacterized protein YjbI with pentapeptide repeats